MPFCLARIPQNGEVRGNLAAGGKGVAQVLSKKDFEIANQIGPVLAKRGLLNAVQLRKTCEDYHRWTPRAPIKDTIILKYL